MHYLTLAHRLDAKALTLANPQGELINIRPKTCQLLLFLIERAGEPQSKQAILESVWANSVVAEQVVFQSVNEIRRLFPDSEVIKTIPKKGYMWLPEVTKEPEKKQTKHNWRKFAPLISAVLVVFVAIIALLNWPDSQTQDAIPNTLVKGSVIVLPIQNHIEGNDLSWIRLGMMDQVIQRLPNNQDHGILQTDYVLEVLERADAPFSNINSEHIQQVFTVSGAELVVSATLAGTPHDYQLSYTFHYRNRQHKGVLFEREIQTLIDAFSLLIGQQLGDEQLLNNANYHADFNNEMLGVAIDLRLEGNHQGAKPLLESIVTSNPENLTAQRLLIETLFDLKQTEQVAKQLTHALPIAARLNDPNEHTRLLYLQAIYLHYFAQSPQAKEVAQQALKIATDNSDWLFMAYIKDMQARFAIEVQDYQLAERLYHEAKAHHQVLRCPVGESGAWADLALLARIQKQPKQFNLALNKAKSIAQSRALQQQLSWLNTLRYEE